jgi:hypothetical protein
MGLGSLGSILGTIDRPTDVDMYLIYIDGGGTFSATTVGTGGSLADTALYLFDENGRGVYANDDADNATKRSTLPAGGSLTPVTAGFYYLAIAASGIAPISSPTDNLIFPSFPFTGVFGPTGPGGGSAISDWRGTGAGTGSYTINLTGAQFANPEPGSLALVSCGLVVLFAHTRRRRRAGRDHAIRRMRQVSS